MGVVDGGGKEAMASQFVRNRQSFGNFNASSENFRTFVVSEDKGFEFYRKIIERAPPTPQVPTTPLTKKLNGIFKIPWICYVNILIDLHPLFQGFD